MSDIKLQDILSDKSLNEFYIIGETAHNHEGDFDYAVKVVNDMVNLPVSAIKIHLNLNLASYANKSFNEVEVYEKFIWPADNYGELIDIIKTSGKEVVALANDVESLDYLMARKDIDAIELHAVSILDIPMLNKLKDFNGVVVLGIGGTDIDEIGSALDILKKNGNEKILFIYGFQNFPSEPQFINLNKMKKIMKFFDVEVGYADHTVHNHPDNIFISTLGYSMGCRVVEKHYTPEEGVKRIDYESSIGKEKFDDLVDKLTLIRDVKGNGNIAVSEGEKSYGCYGIMKKAIVTSKAIKAGHVITESDLLFKRTSIAGSGRQSDYSWYIGKILLFDLEADVMINKSACSIN